MRNCWYTVKNYLCLNTVSITSMTTWITTCIIWTLLNFTTDIYNEFRGDLINRKKIYLDGDQLENKKGFIENINKLY